MSSLIAKFTVVIQHENKQCPFGSQQLCSSAHSLPTLTLLQWHYRGEPRGFYLSQKIPGSLQHWHKLTQGRAQTALRGAGTAWGTLGTSPAVPRAARPPPPGCVSTGPAPPRAARAPQGTHGGNPKGEKDFRKMWKQAPETERAEEFRINCNCKAWK